MINVNTRKQSLRALTEQFLWVEWEVEQNFKQNAGILSFPFVLHSTCRFLCFRLYKQKKKYIWKRTSNGTHKKAPWWDFHSTEDLWPEVFIFMVPKQTPNKLSTGIENNSQLDPRLILFPKQAYSIDYEQLFWYSSYEFNLNANRS